MKNSLLAIIILFSTIAFGQENTSETPKIAVKVSMGETVLLKGVSIKFMEVVEDSRCPEGVNCIWAGRAIVKVEVTNNGVKEERTLTFGATRPNEEKNTNIFSSNEFAVNGIKLIPYPTTESTEKDTGYVLLICEAKNR